MRKAVGIALNHSEIDVHVEPPPGGWWGARQGLEVPERWREAAGRFRGELGVPAGRVMMSGHQPGFWHAGILAKVLAVDAVCGAGCAAAWVVVDHDPDSPVALRFPTRGWGEEAARFADGEGRAPSGCAPWRGERLEAAGAFDALVEPIGRVEAAMRAHASAANLERQVTLAGAELLDGAGLPGRVLRDSFAASRIGRTALFEAIVREWSEPARAVEAVRAYNRAAAAYPEAGIRPLEVSDADAELPVWRVEGGRRLRVMASAVGGGALVPRALFMTMLLRLAGCDVFVHGLGGGN